VFHVEVKQASQVARAFNLTEQELQSRLLVPLAHGGELSFADRDWDPRELRVTILEGRRLAPNELMLGRNWTNAQKVGSDVTARVLADVHAQADRRALAQRVSERMLGRIAAGPLELDSAVVLVDDLLAGRPVSERLQVTAEAAWELLHRHQAALLDADGATIARERWQPVLLAWADRSGDQATTSSIRLARS
jgi:hypothetical protein